MSRITFCLSCLCRFTTHLLDPGWGLTPPCGGLPRGPQSTFLSVDGGRSRIFSSGTTRGPAVDVFYVDGGRSWITSSGTFWGPPSTFLSVDGGLSRIFSSGTSWGPAVDVS
jgi:hypothetical protein